MRQQTLVIQTPGRGCVEITAQVGEVVEAAGIDIGLVHLFVRHTSASLLINENADPDVQRDLETVFSGLAPDGDPRYVHDAEGPDDMAAHVRSALTGVSLTVPVSDGELALGTWQGIYLWEHRTSPQRREVVVTVQP
jgi:secondary thiamine-phosphate synthase enzyme